MPNRRAARALTSCFLEASEQKATLLPKIRILGDVEDDEFDLETSLEIANALPQSINTLERKIELTKLIQQWVHAMSEETRRFYGDDDIAIPSSQADALYLADELCILLGQVTQEEINWKTIQKIVPQDHAEWWRLTTTFLKIIMEHWPQYLDDRNLVDPAQKTYLKLKLRAELFEEHGSDNPVIIAGSTGSVKSTQYLLRAVSKLPNGAVVLPGLDMEMPDAEWNSLQDGNNLGFTNLETHPQFGLARLLIALQTERKNVLELGTSHHDKSKRQSVVNKALAAPQFTANWFDSAQPSKDMDIERALSGIAYINASNERQEATAIAIALREALITPQKTAALVTPDRNLASRVAMELTRFGVDVDDTGGTPLRNAKPSLFLRQIANLVFDDAPGNLAITTVLKNPLCTISHSNNEAQRLARIFEMVALRGVIQSPETGKFHRFVTERKAVLQGANYASVQLKSLTDEAWEQLNQYAQKLDDVFMIFASLTDKNETLSLASLIENLFSAAQILSTDVSGRSNLFDLEGAEELKKLYDDITTTNAGFLDVRIAEFPNVFEALLSDGTVRPRYSKNPRLHIYGPLEVRLLNHDRVILAGLNEGTWPQTSRNDAFLNRLMRHELGMASPERRVGLAAHDFQQLMGCDEVILSRSSRVDKAPTVASRWIQRFFALIGQENLENLTLRGKTYLKLAAYLDDGEPTERVKRPNPTPPVDVRPTSLPVTAIETWIRDPYALYANRILNLKPLEPLEREPDALLKGTLYHAIMQEYVETVLVSTSQTDRYKALIEIAEKHIVRENLPVETNKLWQFRFNEIAREYIIWEKHYLANSNVAQSFCEIKGSIVISDDFTLTARADRIDIFNDEQINIIDYKTGTSPSPKQARNLSPQLALEGLIAQHSGFENISNTDLFDLIYMRLMQGEKFNAERITNKDNPLSAIIENAASELTKLVQGFKQEAQGYISRRAPFLESEMSNDYDHLARTREWSFGEEGEADE